MRDTSKQDWKKLVHLFKYLRGNQDIPLIPRAGGNGILKWYVDASHGVHPNIRSHTGGVLTMVTGVHAHLSLTDMITNKGEKVCNNRVSIIPNSGN